VAIYVVKIIKLVVIIKTAAMYLVVLDQMVDAIMLMPVKIA
jgi:hypothetical protein